jgi:hypothetical protein
MLPPRILLLICRAPLACQGQGRGRQRALKVERGALACPAQDGPEYYRPRGGLLAFDMQLGDLLASAAPTGGGASLSCFEGHFRLVNAQLAQVDPTPLHLSKPPQLALARQMYLPSSHALSAMQWRGCLSAHQWGSWRAGMKPYVRSGLWQARMKPSSAAVGQAAQMYSNLLAGQHEAGCGMRRSARRWRLRRRWAARWCCRSSGAARTATGRRTVAPFPAPPWACPSAARWTTCWTWSSARTPHSNHKYPD